ncbi:MFS transporter [Atopobacter phocae]|uniref:MFS transporter n=1 Tax=Atopobacter phocae TaxID=136492 RepID=UPI0004707394|nr:MFS transporter [Atopobacter phocae]
MPDKLFNKYFIGITLINFIVFLVYYLLMVIIAVIAQNTLQASLSQAGLASGIYILGTLIARLIIGKQLEVFGRRLVLRGGAIFYLISTIAYLYIPSMGMLYFVRLLNGLSYGVVSTATNAIVTAYIPPAQRGEGINYYGLSTSLAAAIGPFIGMILLNLVDFHWIIYFAIALVLIVLVSSFMFPVKNIVLNEHQLAQSKSWGFSSFIEHKAIFISFIAFLMGFAYSSVLAFLSSYTKVINLVEAGSFFFVVYALVITFTRPLSGRIFDDRGEQYVMYPSYLFLAAGLFVLSFTTNSPMLLTAGAFIGLGYGTFMSNGQAVSIKGLNEHRFGTALSTYFIGLDLGLGIGPFLLGSLRNIVSFRELYLIAGVVPLICTVLYFMNRKSYQQPTLTK